ncbi:MAG: TipAS antibiotic-recognition domain-containing protein [Candidatus Paceibacterota bacterium]|jgi:hypothetical protein
MKNPYKKEAQQKWGHTEAFKQSEERVKKLGKDGLKKVIDESEKLTNEIADAMKNGDYPSSENTQKLIAKHYEGLKAFYEPNLILYKGLAEMYIQDERFKNNYEKVASGLAQYMHDAMLEFTNLK